MIAAGWVRDVLADAIQLLRVRVCPLRCFFPAVDAFATPPRLIVLLRDAAGPAFARAGLIGGGFSRNSFAPLCPSASPGSSRAFATTRRSESAPPARSLLPFDEPGLL